MTRDAITGCKKLSFVITPRTSRAIAEAYFARLYATTLSPDAVASAADTGVAGYVMFVLLLAVCCTYEDVVVLCPHADSRICLA